MWVLVGDVRWVGFDISFNFVIDYKFCFFLGIGFVFRGWGGVLLGYLEN